MKINYLNEAFKPISVLKKNSNDLSSEKDLRSSTIKDIISPILTDPIFTKKCSKSCQKYITSDVISQPIAIMNFNYVCVDDDTLVLSAELYYAKNSTGIPTNNLYIIDENFRKYSPEEINKQIDDFITKAFKKYCKDNGSALIKAISNIHINKIHLYSNVPNNFTENGLYTYPLILDLASECISKETKILDEDLLNDTLDKLTNSLFKFCASNLVLSKVDAEIKEVSKFSHEYSLKNIKKFTETLRHPESVPYPNQDEDLAIIFKKMDPYIMSEDIHEYMIYKIEKHISLNKYLKYRDVYSMDEANCILHVYKHIVDTARYFITDYEERDFRCLPEDLWNALSTLSNEDVPILKDIEFFSTVNEYRLGAYNEYTMMPYNYGKFMGTVDFTY